MCKTGIARINIHPVNFRPQWKLRFLVAKYLEATFDFYSPSPKKDDEDEMSMNPITSVIIRDHRQEVIELYNQLSWLRFRSPRSRRLSHHFLQTAFYEPAQYQFEQFSDRQKGQNICCFSLYETNLPAQEMITCGSIDNSTQPIGIADIFENNAIWSIHERSYEDRYLKLFALTSAAQTMKIYPAIFDAPDIILADTPFYSNC